MKKILMGLFIIFNLMGVAHAEQGILVAITVDKGNEASEYYGTITKERYDSITKTLKENVMLRLEGVFWINGEGKIEHMSTTNRHGHRFGYSNTVFLREDDITRIVILDKEYLNTLKEK